MSTSDGTELVWSWSHNVKKQWWELRCQDPLRKPIAWVTDEMLARLAMPQLLTRKLLEAFGSVPEPLQQYEAEANAAIAAERETPLFVSYVIRPGGECPLHGTKGDCPCTDTGL